MMSIGHGTGGMAPRLQYLPALISPTEASNQEAIPWRMT